MIVSDSTLNAAIFVTTLGGFVKTACANTVVDGVLGLLIFCMAAGFSYMANMRNIVKSHSV
jgi:hypothetical protein